MFWFLLYIKTGTLTFLIYLLRILKIMRNMMAKTEMMIVAKLRQLRFSNMAIQVWREKGERTKEVGRGGEGKGRERLVVSTALM